MSGGMGLLHGFGHWKYMKRNEDFLFFLRLAVVLIFWASSVDAVGSR
jgi:hypothetical protein